jgi:hypothetical protein
VDVFKIVTVTRAVCAVSLLLGSGERAEAQGFDLTFFVGRAFPTYDERLTLRPSTPALPGVDISVQGSPLIEADGGPVFGGALAFEFGVLGIEGRLDATDVGLAITGARYNLRGTRPPLDGLTASITVSDGQLDADRIPLLSVNARIRTPGSVALVASGGLTYLSSISVTGSIPVRLEIPGVPLPPSFAPRLTLRAVPGQSEHRWGVNGGAGLRIGGRVALMGEGWGLLLPRVRVALRDRRRSGVARRAAGRTGARSLRSGLRECAGGRDVQVLTGNFALLG